MTLGDYILIVYGGFCFCLGLGVMYLIGRLR